MTLSFDAQTITVITFSLVFIAVVHKWRRSFDLPLPPGPRAIFSYALMPKSNPFTKIEEWTQQYGPVFSLRQGFGTVVVVGRVQAMIDIMEKQGASIADRPKNTPAGEVLSGGMRILMMSSGERFRRMRRALHAYLQPKMVTKYSPILMERAKQHLLGILDIPSSHQLHAKFFAASVIMTLTYDITPERHDDPDIVTVSRCLYRFGEIMAPGRWKVDTFPFLRYIPGYFKELHEGHAEELALFSGKLRQVKKRLERGELVPDCFARYLLENQRELELSDSEAAYLAGAMFEAGTETTGAAITISIMAAACHPDAQRRVQEELYQLIGERAPTSADLNMLPELHAYALETLRWRPIAANPLGAPHKTSKDIFWQNYRIPKHTTIVGSVWAIGKDPDFFPNPETFDPQRWINKDGKVKEELRSFPFGFGRRVCPGQHLANASLLLNTALLLWAFNIKEDPSTPIDSMALEDSVATVPFPFKVIFEPRAAKTADGIREILSDYAL